MSHVVKGRGGTKNVESDWVRIREKTLCPAPRRCLDCRADVDPIITPHGAQVFTGFCGRCRERKAHERAKRRTA